MNYNNFTTDDTIIYFIDDNKITKNYLLKGTTTSKLYNEYVKYCAANGWEKHTLIRKSFTFQIKEHFYVDLMKSRSGTRYAMKRNEELLYNRELLRKIREFGENNEISGVPTSEVYEHFVDFLYKTSDIELFCHQRTITKMFADEFNLKLVKTGGILKYKRKYIEYN